MPLYIFASFEPRPGKRDDLRAALTLVLEPSRAEAGCVRIHLYESTAGPCCFYIHAEWVDAATFEAHAAMPHVAQLAAAVEELATHSLQAARTRQIA